MAAPQRFFFANRHDAGPVETQKFDCRSSLGGKADYLFIPPLEMFIPSVFARIEDRDTFFRFRIGFYLSRFLSKRAGDTSKRKIARNGFTGFALRNDMVDVKGSLLANLR
jgi:hypothetical protein